MSVRASGRRRAGGPPVPLLVLAGLAALALSGCGGSAASPVPATTAAPAAATQPLSSPALVGRVRGPVRRGEVQVPAGPFSDRVELRDLVLRLGRMPRVTGSIRNRVDVSDVIVLELRVDFYDSEGRRVGAGSVVYDGARPFDRRALRFSVAAYRPAPSAVAAVLTIPQLVNE